MKTQQECILAINHWQESLISLIDAALAEDIGSGDMTSELLIPGDLQAEMAFVARQEMVACGAFIPSQVYARLDPSVQAVEKTKEGQWVAPGTALAAARGNARAILAGERVALNLMQRMCGVATLTKTYVDAVRGTNAVILDTRKTMPGMRRLDKYAVTCGGGQNHRMGLWDMVLVKDNHLAVRHQGDGSRIQALVENVKKELASRFPDAGLRPPIVVECDTLAQVEEAITAHPDRILLDNMDTAMLKRAVALASGKVKLEASGGVSLESVRPIAETGVDYISIGKLTHSAPAADIGGDMIFSAGA